MKYLLDTNIFLEILLKQEKSEACKLFINDNEGKICVTDFALHSIGIILFRNNRFETFNLFMKDFVSRIYLLTLDKNSYSNISRTAMKYKLDFDDCYQLTVANKFNLTLITLDSNFADLSREYKIIKL